METACESLVLIAHAIDMSWLKPHYVTKYAYFKGDFHVYFSHEQHLNGDSLRKFDTYHGIFIDLPFKSPRAVIRVD